MPHWSFHEAQGLLNEKLRIGWIPTKADIATLLLDTATSARRTSECAQTFGVKGLTYESLLSEIIRMDNFGRSEAFNSISLWTGKNFWAINFLKHDSWKHSRKWRK